jgi:DNA-directed RNA polymerase specialized sigma24 family protein
MNLRAPSDNEPHQGARFEVHFEKARGLNGKETDPFEASLELRDAKAVWAISDLEDARRAEILELKEEGLSLRAIGKELGISKSAVQRALSKGKASA